MNQHEAVRLARRDHLAVRIDQDPAPVTNGTTLVEPDLLDANAGRRLERMHVQRRDARDLAHGVAVGGGAERRAFQYRYTGTPSARSPAPRAALPGFEMIDPTTT